MKIAVSGAANTGKSTIVNYLRDDLTLPLIGENRKLINTVVTGSDDIKKMLKGGFAWVREKRTEENYLESKGFGYVSDRCTLDIFSFCCVKPRFKSNEKARMFHDLCREECKHYDFLIIPQWGVISDRDSWQEGAKPIHRLDARPKPTSNPWFNLNRHTTIVGLAYTWFPPEKVLLIPREVVDINERVEWIKSKIGA